MNELFTAYHPPHVRLCETLQQRWETAREPDQYGPVRHPRYEQWRVQWGRCLTLETIERLGGEVLDPRAVHPCKRCPA